LIRAQYTVLLHSESGAGKSSMVEAGLRPELTRRGCLILPRARLQQDAGAGVAINPFVSGLLQAWRDLEVESPDPGATTLAGFLGVHATDPERPNIRVVVLDQFEELFILHPGHWPERRDFFVQVQEALDTDPMLRFLFVMRGDYLAQIGPYTHLLKDGLRAQCPLDRLRRDNAIEAIRRPAHEAGRSFADGVAETLVDNLLAIPGEADEQPLAAEHVEAVELQIVCRDLWENLPPEVAVIRNEHLHSFGRIDEILERFYDRAVAETAAGTKVKERTLRTWFDDNLITKAKTRGIVIQDEQFTAGLPNSAVALLAERRVIRSEPRGRSVWWELTHDRLVNAVANANQRWFQHRLSTRTRQLVAATAALFVLGALLVLWLRFTEAQRADPIVSLDTSGEIAQANETDEFEVAGNGGDTVVLSVRPDEELDSTLSLVDPDGTMLKSDPVDGISGSHVVWQLPDDGLYKVRVSSPGEGKYTLRGGLVDAEARAAGEPLDGEVGESGEVDVFTFHQNKPGTVVVRMLAKTDLDGLIELIGPNGELLATADDAGKDTNPFLGVYLPATGDYRVEASAYGASTGAYTADIERSAATSLEAKPVSDSLARGNSIAYTVSASQGEPIVVHMDSEGTLDCSIALFGPRGELLAEGGSPTSRDAVAAYVATTSGRHTVVAFSQVEADRGSAGSFRISLLGDSLLQRPGRP
jgi:hypothetical protein